MGRRAGWMVVVLVLIAATAWLLFAADERSTEGTETSAAERPAESGPAPVTASRAAEGAGIRTVAEGALGGTPKPASLPDRRMHLLVVDSRGNPLAGARVETFADSTPGVWRTEPDGSCWLAVAPSDQNLKLRVEADGCFHVNAFYERREELRVVLARSRTLTGVVRDEEKQRPVAGAQVSLPHGDCRGCPAEVVRSGPDGGFVLASVRAGSGVGVVVAAAGYPTQIIRLKLEDQPGPAQRDLVLRHGCEVHATVVDLDTGAPVAGAEVRDATHTGESCARTDAAGRFQALLLLDDKRTLSVELTVAGYCRMTCSFTAEDLAAGEVRITWPRSAPISGTVRDAEGRPVAGAQVTVRRDWHTMALRQVDPARGNRPDATPKTPLDALPSSWRVLDEDYHPSATTDDMGRFRTPGVVPWTSDWEVTARHPQHVEGIAKVARAGAPGEAAAVEVVLARLGATGVVLGRMTLNGKPCQGRIAWKGPTREGSVATGRSGAFRLEQVEAGPVQVTAIPADLRSGRAQSALRGAGPTTVAVTADSDVRCDFDLHIEMAAISGHVRRRGGSPVIGASVVADVDGVRVRALSGTDGMYALEMPAALGPWRLFAFAEGQTLTRTDVKTGSVEVDFVLPDAGRLLWRTVDAASGKTAAADLYWRQADAAHWDGGSRRLVGDPPDERGFRSTLLATGTWQFMARATDLGYQPEVVANARVTAGQQLELTFSLRRGASVYLRLDGEPLPHGCTVLLLDADAWDHVRFTQKDGSSSWDTGARYPGRSLFERALQFDRDGEARIGGLPAGRHRFKVFEADLALEPEEIVLGEGEEKSVTLRWRRVR